MLSIFSEKVLVKCYQAGAGHEEGLNLNFQILGTPRIWSLGALSWNFSTTLSCGLVNALAALSPQ